MSDKDKVEQELRMVGNVARFITPVLVTVALYMLADVKREVDKVSDLVPRVAVLEVQIESLKGHHDNRK